MRYLVLLFLLCGCAHSRYEIAAAEKSSCELNFWARNGFRSRSFNRCREEEREEKRRLVVVEAMRCYDDPKCDTAQKRQRLQEEEYQRQRENLKMAAGTSIGEYTKYFGEPDSKELFDKKKMVYWYNGQDPFFAVFEDGKLVSYVIDRETINRRADRNDRNRRDAMFLEEQRAESRRRAWQAAFQSSAPVNCTSSQFGRTTYTNCR